MGILHVLAMWVLSAILFLVLGKLPLGIRINGFSTALIVALVFGLLNFLVKPLFQLIALPLTILTFGLFSFVVNACIFALAAWLVPGFELKGGFVSALLGSIALSLLNWVVFFVFRGPGRI